MPEMTVKYNKEELEDMLVRLLLRPQGLKLASVENAIQWKYRPSLKVVIQAEVDATVAAEPTPEPKRDPLEEAATPIEADEILDPRGFPPGTNLEALKSALNAEKRANQRPLMPGETLERKKR